MSGCDHRGHRFSRAEPDVCLRCGHIEPRTFSPSEIDTQCARRLRPEWTARCSRPASVARGDLGFCHHHDPGENATPAQAATFAANMGGAGHE